MSLFTPEVAQKFTLRQQKNHLRKSRSIFIQGTRKTCQSQEKKYHLQQLNEDLKKLESHSPQKAERKFLS